MAVKKYLLILLAVFFVEKELFAHEDPLGDVHPLVRVEDGNFAIYFSNNSASRDPDHELPRFRVVYSQDGELLAPRHSVPKAPPADIRAILGGVSGMTVPVGDSLLVFSSPRLDDGKLFYMVESKGGIERHSLPWPDAVKISDLHAVIADEDSITIAAKAGTAALSFFHFKRDGLDLPEVVTIGNPLTIYEFPVASNLLFAGGKYWIAWMRGGKGESKTSAVLSSWSPGDKAPIETVLDGPGDWNSDLSIEVSGDFLCVAYHCSSVHDFSSPSKIYTFFRRIR